MNHLFKPNLCHIYFFVTQILLKHINISKQTLIEQSLLYNPRNIFSLSEIFHEEEIPKVFPSEVFPRNSCLWRNVIFCKRTICFWMDVDFGLREWIPYFSSVREMPQFKTRIFLLCVIFANLLSPFCSEEKEREGHAIFSYFSIRFLQLQSTQSKPCYMQNGFVYASADIIFVWRMDKWKDLIQTRQRKFFKQQSKYLI